MLWHKAWLETRWRFVAGLVILTVMAGAKVYEYVSPADDAAGGVGHVRADSSPLGAAIRDAIAVQREFRGFIWYNAFRDNLTQMGVLFAVLLGCGGLARGIEKGFGALHAVAAGDAQAAARRPRRPPGWRSVSRSRWCRRWLFRCWRRRSASSSA